MNLVYFNLFLIILINSFNHIDSKEWIDVADMVDPRILQNRNRYSSSNKRIKISYEIDLNHNSRPFEDHGDSVLNYIPKNPFPNTETCLDKSLQIENANEMPDNKRQLECISNKLRTNSFESYDNEKTNDNRIDNGEQQQKLQSCMVKNKELIEELVCFRNLKSLYTRYHSKINSVVNLMKYNDQKIEFHPYSTEFHILFKTLQHNNCLSAVDDLEKLVSKLDNFLYRIEPVDYSKHLTYGGIIATVLFCFYYVYRYLKLKYLVYALVLFIVYAHEYYYLLLEKKAEINNELRKFHNCKESESGIIKSIFNFLFGGLYSAVSFKGDHCDINEDYLYIDAVFKINPLSPVFTLLPKLFTKTVIILFENSAIAFRKFSSQLPILHAYPILLIFLALIIVLVYLAFDWNIKSKKLELDHKKELKSLESPANSSNLSNLPIKSSDKLTKKENRRKENRRNKKLKLKKKSTSNKRPLEQRPLEQRPSEQRNDQLLLVR